MSTTKSKQAVYLIQEDGTVIATLPISAVSLPLPAGASTETTSAAILADTTAALSGSGVKQGTKAAGADAWPIRLVDPSGNDTTITLDGVVYRQEVQGKVTIVGASAPPATTPVEIDADIPLTVGTHDTSFLIPSGETFHLQTIIAGNEDPTKGASVEVIYDDGTEHVVARVYTSGTTTQIGYSDVNTARNGTSLDGTGTETIIVRRLKFSGTDIAIDTVVTGYTKTT